MAIAQDAVTNLSFSSSGASSYSFNHAMGSVSNGLLLVCVECDDGDHLIGVTANSVAMTQLVKFNQTSDSTCIYIYGILAPTAGTNVIVITRSSTGSTLTGGSVSFSGVLQTGLPDATATNHQTTGTTLTTSITSVASSCWLFGFFQADNQGITAGSGSTIVNTGPSATGPWSMFLSTANPVPPGGHSMAMNCSSGASDMIAISLAPAAAAGVIGAATNIRQAVNRASTY